MPLSTFADNDQETSSAPNSSADQIGNYYEVDDDTGAIPSENTLSSKKTQQIYEPIGSDDGQVKVNKTISPTNSENLFNVNLEVITKERIDNTAISPDAAVVLVIDTSNSMMRGNRLQSAKDAAKSFIRKFADKDATRKVAIVKFSGDYFVDGAKLVSGWTEVSTGNELDSQINSLKANGGTNMEAGLQRKL